MVDNQQIIIVRERNTSINKLDGILGINLLLLYNLANKYAIKQSEQVPAEYMYTGKTSNTFPFTLNGI